MIFHVVLVTGGFILGWLACYAGVIISMRRNSNW